MIRKNIKLIIGILIGVILTSGVGVYALYIHARDVSFTPTHEKFSVENVNDALNYLYENEKDKNSIYIPKFDTALYAPVGGGANQTILTKGLSKLSVGRRSYDDVIGTTYFQITGYSDENCSLDSEFILNTTAPSSTKEVFDISKYLCIELEVSCTEVGSRKEWLGYHFYDIRLYDE